jgi:hypothetical protein
MFTKKLATAALVAITLLPGFAIAAPSAAPAPHAGCIMAGHKVLKVQPLNVSERYGRGTVERLAGARVFVQAEPGLTAEWLQLSLQRHIAQMNGTMANCPLDIKDVKVSVSSAGSGFAVQIVGKDAAQAKEILRRAQLLAQ